MLFLRLKAKTMNKDEAIKIVESSQKWAKGDDSQPQPNMIEVYEAIELLLAEVKNNSRLENVMKNNTQRPLKCNHFKKDEESRILEFANKWGCEIVAYTRQKQ
jgi:hypothetical protein